MGCILATHRLGVSKTSSNHAQQDAVGNGDLLVGESGPLGDPGSGGKVLRDELARGSGSGSYAATKIDQGQFSVHNVLWFETQSQETRDVVCFFFQ
jgi:hypothetical protein